MIVMAASSSIVHSDQSGIPDGTIVMGRYFGNEEIKNFGILSNPSPVISQITSADLSGPSVHVAPVTEDTIEGRTTVRDISGNDAFVISYTASREFYQQGKETIQFFLMIQLAIMLMLGLFIFYRLDSSILTRLDTIIADTRAVSDGITKRIRKSGDDEIAQLAESINQMLGRVDKSHRDHLDSEEKFRSFTQESTDGYVLLDSNGNVLEWNAAAERITGITRNEALGTSAIEIHTRLIPPEYKTPERTENIRQAFASFIKTGEFAGFCKPIEIEIIRPDGTRRTVQQITFPIRISGDWLMGVITRDITEHRLAEEALQQARKKMNMLNTITFQDIQNAIFALSGYHELAGKFITGPEGKGILEKEETILKKIEHSLTIAKNFQNLGINPPKWQGVNQVFIFALSHLDLKQITRTVKVDDLEIYADPLLEKVFTNLLENSIQHGESVTAISLLYRKTRTILEIIYEDNGKGIPSKKKESVFERGHSPDLGLFLVREILSITGITIQEIGIEGQGARFIITVPEGLYRFGGDRH
jgi:PAS domain S-box-containing protein